MFGADRVLSEGAESGVLRKFGADFVKARQDIWKACSGFGGGIGLWVSSIPKHVGDTCVPSNSFGWWCGAAGLD